jgi:hypothetical protein
MNANLTKLEMLKKARRLAIVRALRKLRRAQRKLETGTNNQDQPR